MFPHDSAHNGWQRFCHPPDGPTAQLFNVQPAFIFCLRQTRQCQIWKCTMPQISVFGKLAWHNAIKLHNCHEQKSLLRNAAKKVQKRPKLWQSPPAAQQTETSLFTKQTTMYLFFFLIRLKRDPVMTLPCKWYFNSSSCLLKRHQQVQQAEIQQWRPRAYYSKEVGNCQMSTSQKYLGKTLRSP